MKKNELLCPMVKSSNFEDLFRKQRLNQSEEEIEDITSDLIDLSISIENDRGNVQNKIKVVKIIDFAISCAEHIGMTGSQLFSMLLEKESLIKKNKNDQ